MMFMSGCNFDFQLLVFLLTSTMSLDTLPISPCSMSPVVLQELCEEEYTPDDMVLGS